MRAAQAVGLLVVARPAMASREAETLEVVPILLGMFASMVGQVLLAMTLLAIAATPLLIWIGRRVGASSRQPSAPPAVVSLLEAVEQRSPPAADEGLDEQRRQAQVRAQAEAIDLRPRARPYSDVDEDTRRRIAAAAKRLDPRAAPEGGQSALSERPMGH